MGVIVRLRIRIFLYWDRSLFHWEDIILSLLGTYHYFISAFFGSWMLHGGDFEMVCFVLYCHVLFRHVLFCVVTFCVVTFCFVTFCFVLSSWGRTSIFSTLKDRTLFCFVPFLSVLVCPVLSVLSRFVQFWLVLSVFLFWPVLFVLSVLFCPFCIFFGIVYRLCKHTASVNIPRL